jgi:hypothetical protein
LVNFDAIITSIFCCKIVISIFQKLDTKVYQKKII